jgi:putative acetyltransferase
VAVEIREPNRAEVEVGRRLIEEYVGSLGIDLSFQQVEEELADIERAYGPPRGRLLLAFVHGEPAGCVAVRPLHEGCCEMKRLYVRPTHRGLGLGRSLADAAIEAGRELGYERMRLDTLPDMEAARALYRSLGFREIAPYRFNPMPGTAFMERALR